ncbi:MAG: tetratricopeptide repeat protein [Phycisphaerales bacterium]|nr:tetratricopeptide repeat protein [Phycisphaerales bacterium]
MTRLLVAALLLLLAAGCNGPTRAGKAARNAAHERMDRVNAELAAQQATQQFEVGRLDDALDIINGAIERYPKSAEYQLLKGRILLEQHRLDPARAAFAEASSLDRSMAEPHYMTGILHQRWSDDATALQHYSAAMEADPTHPQYLLATAETMAALGRMGEAAALLEEQQAHFEHHPAVPTLLGQVRLREGRPGEAADHLSEARLLRPADTEVVEDLAIAQFRAGRFSDCLSTLRDLEQWDEEPRPMLQRLHAKCLVATGQLIAGRDMSLQVTRRKPDDVEAWADLGLIAWKMGDYNRLRACGSRIGQLAPQRPEGDLYLGIADMHEGQFEDARAKLATIRGNEAIGQLLAAMPRLDRPITPRTSASIPPNAADPRNTAGDSADIALQGLDPGPDEGSRPVAHALGNDSLQP